MSDSGYMAALAPCFTCKNPFMFDPELVVSIPIDPENGKPPDLGGDPQRAVKMPICNTCLHDVINPGRKAKGMPLISIPDDPAQRG